MSEAAHQGPPKWPGRLRRGIAWATLWATGILVIVIIIKPSEPFKGCIHANKNGDPYQALHEGDPGAVARITRFYLRSRLVGICAANFADKNERTIGALAAVALAVFTLYLWRATHGLRQYAGLQVSDMQSLLSAAEDTAAAAASQVKAIEAQEHVMREQAATMAANLDLARNAVKVAQASADAALRSANAAERSLTFIERPWIDVRLDRSGDVTIGADAITAEISVNIRNFGRSPALRTSPTLRLLPTFDAARCAYDTAVEIARQVHLDTPIRTIRGMLAPNEPYEEISIKEMRRPRDDELPPADPENDYFGLFMVACVSYAAPASTRPLYTAGIFEIAFRDGRSIDFRNRGDFVLSAYEIIIRDLGFSRAV